MRRMFELAGIIMLAGTLAACSIEDTENNEGTHLTLDINPSVEFIVDEDDEIDSYSPLNEDGEKVLADLDLEGMDYEEALDLYLEEATEHGHIDVNADDNSVYVATNEDEDTTEDEEADQEGDTDEDGNTEDEGSLEDRVKEKVDEHFKSRGIPGSALDKDLEETYGDIAEEHDLGLGKARLLSRVAELDEELTMDEAVEMNMGDVMAILRADHQERMEEFRQEKRGNGRNSNDDTDDEDPVQVQGQSMDDVDTRTNGMNNAPVDFEDVRGRIASGLENAPVNFEDIRNRIANGLENASISFNDIKNRISNCARRGAMGGNNPFFGNDDEDTEAEDADQDETPHDIEG